MVNEDRDHCWCVHFTALNELILRSSTTSYPSLFTAFQAVLARTACSLKDDRLPLSDHYHWLGTPNKIAYSFTVNKSLDLATAKKIILLLDIVRIKASDAITFA